jgi:hypothetical protein
LPLTRDVLTPRPLSVAGWFQSVPKTAGW